MTRRAAVRALAHYLPARVLTNDEIAAQSGLWSPSEIEAKLGVRERRLAGDGESASDLAAEALRRLFDKAGVAASDVDWLVCVTQSPDYLLPTTACLLQHRLGLPKTAGALDVNLGCSGFVYGLGLAKGLIETGQASALALVTVDTYSKYLHPEDWSTRTLFGDAAAAALVVAEDGERDRIGPFVWGTDGDGAELLILRRGGAKRWTPSADAEPAGRGACLHMDGPGIFAFSLREVPKACEAMLKRAGRTIGDVDLFVFHQANRYMLEHLRKRLGIPEEKFVVHMATVGNTTSSSIPIALEAAEDDGRLRRGMTVMLVGFGVGLSWAAALIEW